MFAADGGASFIDYKASSLALVPAKHGARHTQEKLTQSFPGHLLPFINTSMSGVRPALIDVARGHTALRISLLRRQHKLLVPLPSAGFAPTSTILPTKLWCLLPTPRFSCGCRRRRCVHSRYLHYPRQQTPKPFPVTSTVRYVTNKTLPNPTSKHVGC